MKKIIYLILLILIIQSCKNEVEISSVNPVNWGKRTIDLNLTDSSIQGTTYLSVYSQIYSQSEHRTHDLTATVSMRNLNKEDTVFITNAEYFDTKGNSIQTYFEKPIFIAPMETVQIIIDENDQHGGTGANFLFDWAVKPKTNAPIFDAVMISTSGQQGLSFSTEGKKVN